MMGTMSGTETAPYQSESVVQNVNVIRDLALGNGRRERHPTRQSGDQQLRHMHLDE